MYKTIFLNNLQKFIIKKNTKDVPFVKWSNPNNYTKNIDIKKYNIGILTGKINNLLVIDVDKKDDGIEEFKKYTDVNGFINTFTVKSPNDGYHYYFSYKNSDETVQHLIDESLMNKSKYRYGKGIDIRSNGGYIVGPDSSINGKKYEIINDIEPIELPEKLVVWLLEGSELKIPTKKTKINPKYINLHSAFYKFEVTDEQLINILDKLDESYYNDYNKWLIVLTVLKNLNKYDIFESFSKKSITKYNRDKNLYFWNYNKGLIDINYLIKKINKEQNSSIPLIEKYKPLPQIIIPNNIKTITFNKKFLEFDDNIFDLYDTIIIESDPGTGKTTHTANQLKKYIDKYNDYQIISLVDIINLAKQQITTFNDENIPLISYQDKNKCIYDDHLVICINSLMILNYMHDDFFKNKILYIDEINSFLENLTINDTLNNNIKIIYEILMKLVKKSHKVILSDAHIKNNVFDFVNFRDNKTKIFIKNEHKKFINIKAVRMNDENLFIQKLLDNIKNNKYFLFGCDSCSIITKLYHKCINDNKDKEKDFVLITSDSKFELTNANEQFKNKWVFYSPSIKTGVDFSIVTKQDHFIYATGNSITPTAIYQQSTRNRNIDTLYYYFESKQKNYTFETLLCVNNHFKFLCNENNNINNVCRQFNENDDWYIIENTFFNIYCHNEYINDCYNTNKRIHFELILKNQGFILTDEGVNKKISKETQKEFKKINDSIDNVNDFLNSNHNDRLKVKYTSIRDTIDFFKFKNDNDIIKYKTIIQDKFVQLHYFNFIKLLQSDDHIDMKIRFLNNSSYDIKQLESTENKILHIKNLYTKHKIKYLSLDQFDNIDKIIISDNEYKILKSIFRSTKTKPVTNNDFKIMMIDFLKNLVGKLNIIDSKQYRNNNNKMYTYKWNSNIFNYYDLYIMYNKHNNLFLL